jgi:hypothetical protein
MGDPRETKEGRVRRRFIGERTLTVFEAMIAEAAEPEAPGFGLPAQS